MTAITFMTVGYGDVAPITYCGRTVAVATGMLVRMTLSLSRRRVLPQERFSSRLERGARGGGSGSALETLRRCHQVVLSLARAQDARRSS